MSFELLDVMVEGGRGFFSAIEEGLLDLFILHRISIIVCVSEFRLVFFVSTSACLYLFLVLAGLCLDVPMKLFCYEK